jgi:hypothetical protein
MWQGKRKGSDKLATAFRNKEIVVLERDPLKWMFFKDFFDPVEG